MQNISPIVFLVERTKIKDPWIQIKYQLAELSRPFGLVFIQNIFWKRRVVIEYPQVLNSLKAISNESMGSDDPKEIDVLQFFDDPKGISFGCITLIIQKSRIIPPSSMVLFLSNPSPIIISSWHSLTRKPSWSLHKICQSCYMDLAKLLHVIVKL